MIDIYDLLHVTLYIIAIIALCAVTVLAISCYQFLKQLRVITARLDVLTDVQGWGKFLNMIPFFKSKKSR